MLYTYKDTELRAKRVFRAELKKIPGIGLMRANYLCSLVGLVAGCRTEAINSYLFFVLVFLIKQYYGTDVFLKRMRENSLKEFLSFKSYKSIRFSAGLPIRGQHTHTNAKTTKSFRFSARRGFGRR